MSFCQWSIVYWQIDTEFKARTREVAGCRFPRSFALNSTEANAVFLFQNFRKRGTILAWNSTETRHHCAYIFGNHSFKCDSNRIIFVFGFGFRNETDMDYWTWKYRLEKVSKNHRFRNKSFHVFVPKNSCGPKRSYYFLLFLYIHIREREREKSYNKEKEIEKDSRASSPCRSPSNRFRWKFHARQR